MTTACEGSRNLWGLPNSPGPSVNVLQEPLSLACERDDRLTFYRVCREQSCQLGCRGSGLETALSGNVRPGLALVGGGGRGETALAWHSLAA